MGLRKVKRIIKIYIHELKKTIKPERVILFGSYARGNAKEDSDIDLVVLSSDFAKIPISRRFDILIEARRHPITRHIGMDIFGLTPKEYEGASPLTTIGEIKETGIKIE